METDDDCFVMCDERMVEQICYNLISNAVSYTGEDKLVTVRVLRQGDKVRAEITDTGRGIATSEPGIRSGTDITAPARESAR